MSSGLKPALGLAAVRSLPLTPRNEGLLRDRLAAAGGTTAWRLRKQAEARDLLALAQLAPVGRLAIVALDLREALRAQLILQVPVACMPDPDRGELVVAPAAMLDLVYPEEATRMPQPGTRFIHIMAPQRVWHANVSMDHRQALCLGPVLPAGVLVRELVLLTYAALSMQRVMVNEYDGAGLLNPLAARFWQQHFDRVPLTTTPFLAADAGPEAGSRP